MFGDSPSFSIRNCRVSFRVNQVDEMDGELTLTRSKSPSDEATQMFLLADAA
jgi:hypothetical protein